MVNSYEPLRLKAEMHEQVDVISALLQDAIFNIDMCSFHEDNESCFRMLFNRFCWELVTENTLVYYRVYSCLYIHNINDVKANYHASRHNKHEFLSLLSIHSTSENELMFLFSEGKHLKISVDQISVYMKDINHPWITSSMPKHPVCLV